MTSAIESENDEASQYDNGWKKANGENRSENVK